jgi:transposase-like protein
MDSEKNPDSKQTRQRKRVTTEAKATIIRRHLADKVPISDLCDEYGVQPTSVYGWLRQVYDNLGLALEVPGRQAQAVSSREQALNRELESVKSKLARKDAVIAELSTEYIALKKSTGEP